MDDPIIYIEPERLAKWKRRYPIHWRWILDMLEADEIIQRGGAHPGFIRLACYRTWELFLSMYDLACRTEKDRQGMRRRFRQLLAECPQTDRYFPHFRQRLNEHKMFVKHGLEPLDPDEMEGGGKWPIVEEI
jgi:hypothetical protein